MALVQQEWPDSYEGNPLTPIEVFGVMVTLVPIFVIEREKM
jgi:hypothetical protein